MYKSMREIGMQLIPFNSVGIVVDTPKDASLKNAIYQDENGNPRTDIGVFQSDETAPEVRDYISRMHRERPEAENIPDKMRNDDAIIEGMPNHGESLLDYEDRVQKMVDDEKEALRSKKLEKKLKELSKSFGVDN